MSHLTTKPTKWPVPPAKTRISLGIRPDWSESLLCAKWVAKVPMLLHADSEDSDQTGRTCHFVGYVMLRLTCNPCEDSDQPAVGTVWSVFSVCMKKRQIHGYLQTVPMEYLPGALVILQVLFCPGSIKLCANISLLFIFNQTVSFKLVYFLVYFRLVMSQSTTKPTKWPVRVCLVKTQISLGICPAQPYQSLHLAKDPRLLHADSEDWSDWADARRFESLLGAQVILLVLPCCSSFVIGPDKCYRDTERKDIV